MNRVKVICLIIFSLLPFIAETILDLDCKLNVYKNCILPYFDPESANRGMWVETQLHMGLADYLKWLLGMQWMRIAIYIGSMASCLALLRELARNKGLTDRSRKIGNIIVTCAFIALLFIRFLQPYFDSIRPKALSENPIVENERREAKQRFSQSLANADRFQQVTGGCTVNACPPGYTPEEFSAWQKCSSTKTKVGDYCFGHTNPKICVLNSPIACRENRSANGVARLLLPCSTITFQTSLGMSHAYVTPPEFVYCDFKKKDEERFNAGVKDHEERKNKLYLQISTGAVPFFVENSKGQRSGLDDKMHNYQEISGNGVWDESITPDDGGAEPVAQVPPSYNFIAAAIEPGRYKLHLFPKDDGISVISVRLAPSNPGEGPMCGTDLRVATTAGRPQTYVLNASADCKTVKLEQDKQPSSEATNDQTFLSVITNSAVRFQIINPEGKTTGYDPKSKNVLTEIAGSSYHTEGNDDLGDSYIFELDHPATGTYTVKLFADVTSSYVEEVDAYDSRGAESTNQLMGKVKAGSVEIQTITYSSVPGSKVVTVKK